MLKHLGQDSMFILRKKGRNKEADSLQKLVSPDAVAAGRRLLMFYARLKENNHVIEC